MRFNKQELATLASHSEHKFQKQGVLILREKSDGFFHRTENESDGKKKSRSNGSSSSSSKVEPKKVSKKRMSSLSCIGPISSQVSTDRWFRLCGNLLFYLKTKDQWSEPTGVIVLENYTVRIDTKTTATYQPTTTTSTSSQQQQQQVFYFVIDFVAGGFHCLGAFSESDRTGWMDSLKVASFSMLRNRLTALRTEIQNLVGSRRQQHRPTVSHSHAQQANNRGSLESSCEDVRENGGHCSASSQSRVKHSGYVTDVSESPICEISLACDNLLCDAHGRPPTPKCVVHVRNGSSSSSGAPSTTDWVKYASTELVEKSSNPTFLTTIYFRASDGLNESTQLRFTVYDVRERNTQIQLIIGQLFISLESLKVIDRIRLPISLSSPQHSIPHIHGGFLTLIVWNLEKEDRYSTESTPCRLTTIPAGTATAHAQAHATSNTSGTTSPPSAPVAPRVTNYYNNGGGGSGQSQTLLYAHRRTQSLPPILGSKLKLPLQTHFNLLHSHPYVQTYRFHSGLGGDIFVHEIMAESKLSFTFPQQLLSVWIAEEKELLQEMIGLGELREPWHSKQVALLEKHLWLINHYTNARAALMTHKGNDFKLSSTKGDVDYEFVPLNLHLQRIWAQNESLHKNGFHDVITVGAFSAFSQGYESGGLVKLLHSWKQIGETTTKSSKGSQSAWYVTNKVNMTYDSVQGIKRLRSEIVERMQLIMKLTKERSILGLHRYVEDIYHRCRLLLSICDQSLIEEAFDFLEQQKLTTPSCSLLEFDKIIVHHSQDETATTATSTTATSTTNHLNHLNVDEGIIVDTPNSPIRSVVDLFKKRRLVEASHSGHGVDDGTPDSGLGLEDIVKSFLDSPSSNYYRPTEEPEPWDLTILNIEASMISLNSKIKAICGTAANIQPHSLRPSNYYQSGNNNATTANNTAAASIQRTQSVKNSSSIHFSTHAGSAKIINADNWRKSLREEPSLSLVVPRGEISQQQERPADSESKNAAAGATAVVDWSEELRSSIKKLRLAMDGILKTSRLAHCIFRLQENIVKAELGLTIKYRRDVCFSQALTSLVAGLMTRLWTRKPDPTFLYVMTRLGPLASFQGLVTYHKDPAEMVADMMVAIEDLKTVEFVLVLHDSSVSSSSNSNPSSNRSKQRPFPAPKVYGTRSSLKVLLPIPDTLLSILPVDPSGPGAVGAHRRGNGTSFVVTPVFFNIGINQNATIAEHFGNVGPQNKSNLDNFTRLNEYYRRYKKLILPMKAARRNALAEPSLDALFHQLHTELHLKKKKNVDVLHLSAHICRLMMAVRFTSCKSAKDRTGMGVTLEQCQILSQDYDLAEHEFRLALDAMRSEGCRRENTLKNCGSRKYNFNSIQVFALPKLYQPPPGSFGGGLAALE